MNRHAVATCVAVMVGVGLAACSGMGSLGSASSLFSKLGGSGVKNLASDLVSKSARDPRLASLTGGKTVDTASSSGKVSDQLCSMLGGGCEAPMDDSQIATAASRVSPEQSRAISENFDSSLSNTTSDPSTRDRIREAIGNKIPGVLSGLL